MPRNNTKQGTYRKSTLIEPRVNDEINDVDEVRLIYKQSEDCRSEDDFTKVMSIAQARWHSRDKKLDLIEINAKARPVIVLLADYNKYLWNLKKQIKAKTNQKQSQLKEVQLTANITMHDIETKARKAAEFIAAGDKVKVVLTMKGRQLGRRDESKKSFYQFLDKLSSEVQLAYDSAPKDEGNKCIAIVRQKK